MRTTRTSRKKQDSDSDEEDEEEENEEEDEDEDEDEEGDEDSEDDSGFRGVKQFMLNGHAWSYIVPETVGELEQASSGKHTFNTHLTLI